MKKEEDIDRKTRLDRTALKFIENSNKIYSVKATKKNRHRFVHTGLFSRIRDIGFVLLQNLYEVLQMKKIKHSNGTSKMKKKEKEREKTLTVWMHKT